MANNPENRGNNKEPEGLGEHARGRASEAAHQQGWDLNEEERTQQPDGRPAHYGGKGFDYGVYDFGNIASELDSPKLDDPENATDAERKAS